MKEILTATLISLVVSVLVLFTLGPMMMKLNQPAAPTLEAAAPAPASASGKAAGATAVKPAPAEATAPMVEGMQIQAAREAWRAQGILIIEDGNRVDSSVAPGTILDQTPSAGAPLKQREIRTIVAREPEMVAVPNVVGGDIDAARKVLVEAGFEVPPAQREEAEAPGGTVLRQEPNAGATSEKGSVVALVVAADLVEVPKVVGKRLSKAKSILAKAGLPLGSVSQREDEELSGGRVLEQTPEASARVAPGSAVDLVVVAPD